MRILYLDLDTLRADHLSCYGYHRPTSPNIDRIAAEGVRFDNYYCSDAPCLPSRAALMSGRFGIHTGIVNHGGTNADMRLEGAPRQSKQRYQRECLPWLLRKAGMRTASISPFAERHGAFWFLAGFNECHNTGRSGMESAEEITPVALKWLRDHATEDDWFLHLNYWDAHTPYRAPESFGNTFADAPLPALLTPEVLDQHLQHVGPHSAHELFMFSAQELPHLPRYPGSFQDMDGLRRMIDGYDCGIAYLDSHVGRILEALDQAGVLDETAVIVSADHGENQGELGIYGEHATADHPTCRVPMILRWPRGRAGHVDRALHHNLDLAPTLAELLGQEPFERWDGRSYAPTVTQGATCGKEALVLSQCVHVCQRSVRWGPWLYMRTYHDGFHLFPQEMVFNLDDDPNETRNLAPDRTDLCHEAVHRLAAWHDEMMAGMAAECDVDPLWTVIREGGPHLARGQLKAYCRRLEETGRGWAILELKRRHPREFD